VGVIWNTHENLTLGVEGCFYEEILVARIGHYLGLDPSLDFRGILGSHIH
jgi:hypothetical protein